MSLVLSASIEDKQCIAKGCSSSVLTNYTFVVHLRLLTQDWNPSCQAIVCRTYFLCRFWRSELQPSDLSPVFHDRWMSAATLLISFVPNHFRTHSQLGCVIASHLPCPSKSAPVSLIWIHGDFLKKPWDPQWLPAVNLNATGLVFKSPLLLSPTLGISVNLSFPCICCLHESLLRYCKI